MMRRRMLITTRCCCTSPDFDSLPCARLRLSESVATLPNMALSSSEIRGSIGTRSSMRESSIAPGICEVEPKRSHSSAHRLSSSAMSASRIVLVPRFQSARVTCLSPSKSKREMSETHSVRSYSCAAPHASARGRYRAAARREAQALRAGRGGRSGRRCGRIGDRSAGTAGRRAGGADGRAAPELAAERVAPRRPAGIHLHRPTRRLRTPIVRRRALRRRHDRRTVEQPQRFSLSSLSLCDAATFMRPK